MEIQKCSDFINEAKAARIPKSEVKDALLDMFKKKPLVVKSPDAKFKYPDEKGLYSLAGMKQHLDKYKDVDNALADIQNDKSIDLKTTRIKNCLYKNEYIEYWYMDLDKEEVDKIKASYEKDQLEKNKEIVDKQASHKKSSKEAADAKDEIKKEVKAKKAADKKPTVKKPVEKAERKPGGAPKRTATRKK